MPNTLRGTYVRLDAGLDVAFEGRVSEVQRSLGNSTKIQCEGYQGLAADNDASMIFVDRDLTRWQSPSTQRQLNMAQANYQLADSEVAADPTNNNPSIVQTITDSWTSPYEPVAETWYDAGPENTIAKIYYSVESDPDVGGFAPWEYTLYVSSDAQFGANNNTGNLRSTSPESALWTPANQFRFAAIQLWYPSTPAGADGATYNCYWSNLTVIGPHGLSLIGTPPGLYPSAIAGWVEQQIPGLQMGVTQLTDASGYVMPHLVYYTPTGLDQMMSDIATAAGWHWGVWESASHLTGSLLPRLDFRPRPTLGQFTAFCLRRDTDQCDIREDLQNQYNECVISYSNVDGTDGAVTVTIDNPILDQAGIETRTLSLQGGTMVAQTAMQFAQMALLYTYNEARVAGSIQINQAIQSLGGGPRAPFLLKPGIDRLRIGDLPSFDAWGAYNDVPLSRMECTGSGDGLQTSLEVGIGSSMVETLQARLQAATALAAVGG